MKGSKSFKFSAIHAFILLGVILMSSLLYLFFGKATRFEPFTNDKKINIEYFFIKGCPHCEDFDPVWQKVSTDSSLNSKVDFQKLEISANQDRAKKFGISSAPTIIAVQKGDDQKIATAQSEARTVDGFRAFVKSYV